MADRSSRAIGGVYDRGTYGLGTETVVQEPATIPDNTVASGYPSYPGGTVSSASSDKDDEEAAKKEQQKNQAQINNQAGIYQKRSNDMGKNTQKRLRAMEKNAAKRQKQMSKNAAKQLGNIEQSIAANDAALKTNQRNIMQQVQWQPNQQKEQSTMMALRNRMGNAAYGSGIQDLLEGMERVDDMNDVELINAWKQNENAAYSNWYQANEALVNDYNDLVATTKDQLSQFAAEYRNELNDLRSDYRDENSKLNAQYWTSVSNINPLLASKSNMKQATANQQAIDKAKSKLAKANQKVAANKAIKNQVKQLIQNATMVNKQGKALAKSGAPVIKYANDEDLLKAASINDEQALKAAKKLVKQNGAGKKSLKAAKANIKSAKQKVKDAEAKLAKKKDKPLVTVGEDTDQYTLPNIDLSGSANLKSNISLGPSDALKKMLVTKGSAKSQDPMTKRYVRPMQSRGDVLLGHGQGMTNKSSAANQGFLDNLAAFRRV